ncbi:unnamed protein product [Oikopleura dioica]|uniref:Uncharacterized protein n=1 Tax=Oikopleura dioica TaxID=34765 RepID=E4XQ22_OIKDI|nr:unnamed protein product [Oikopleura dioica]
MESDEEIVIEEIEIGERLVSESDENDNTIEDQEPDKEELQPAKAFRRGCNQNQNSKRAQLQARRAELNYALDHQMKLLRGAENLFRATGNTTVKSTVSLELSFVEAAVEILKNEIVEINGTLNVYQSVSETISMPMIPLGIKETKAIDFTNVLNDFILEHYSDEGSKYEPEIAELNSLREGTQTPTRDEEGIDLLFEYYNQLYFIDNRFFPPSRPLGIYLAWFDSLTGIPSIQRNCAFEKACVLFNIGALYTQLGSRLSRAKRDGIEEAIEIFQKAAGAFNYIRLNFSNAPTADMSASFLNGIVNLMLAQAQEGIFEKKMLGGLHEATVEKLISTSSEASKVSEKYKLVTSVMTSDTQYQKYLPSTWNSLVQIKACHYRALSHYFCAMSLIHEEFHQIREPSGLYNGFYCSEFPPDYPKIEEMVRTKKLRRGLALAHLSLALSVHESSLQIQRCAGLKKVGLLLGQYLKHSKKRTQELMRTLEMDEFVGMPPDISPKSDTEAEIVAPNFTRVKVLDIFKRLGPMSIFSARNRFSAPRVIKINRSSNGFGFTVRGDAPVLVANVEADGKANRAGLREGDVVTKVNKKDVKWARHSDVVDMLQCDKLEIEIVTVQGVDLAPQATTGHGHHHHHHERQKSHPHQANHGSKGQKVSRKKSFFGSFGRKSRPTQFSNGTNPYGQTIY